MSNWGIDEIVQNTNYSTYDREEYIKNTSYHVMGRLCFIMELLFQIEANIDSLWIISQYSILA